MLFNATKIIINKIVNISPVPSSPFLKQARLLELLATKCRQDIQSKVKKKLHTTFLEQSGFFAFAALDFFP